MEVIGVPVELVGEPVQITETIPHEGNGGGHSISLLYQCRVKGRQKSLPSNLALTHSISAWHKYCPYDLAPEQSAYAKYFSKIPKLKILLRSLNKHIPGGELIRYLVVGVWNTAFSYGTFALFTLILSKYIPASYMAASLLSSLLNITVSFLGYKWFVFKTKGNYLREWVRCLMVYSTSIVLSLVLLPPTVFLVTEVTKNPAMAPYIAGALLTGFNVIISFIGHKKFSFKQSGPAGG